MVRPLALYKQVTTKTYNHEFTFEFAPHSRVLTSGLYFSEMYRDYRFDYWN